MSKGLAISAFMPSITSCGIFSTRRMGNGADAVASNNPFVGIMNFDIAGGQILNAAKGAANIARETKNATASGIISAEKTIKNLSEGNKVLGGAGKVLNFTADNVNPVICLAGAVKIACSDDKTDTAIKEGMALGTMFAAEGAAKRILGMSKTKNKNGKYIAVEREGLYKKNAFLKKQAAALKDYCAVKTFCNKSLKFLPGTLKGLAFAAASIGGYKTGLAIADKIVPKKRKVDL